MNEMCRARFVTIITMATLDELYELEELLDAEIREKITFKARKDLTTGD